MHELAEILQLIQHQSYARSSDNTWNLTGHIASWDPATNTVTAVIPLYTDEDAVQYIQTPPMQLGTLMAGNGFGMQYVPIGGATTTNPTNGEEVSIHISDTDIGTVAAAHLIFNQSQQVPPSAALNGTANTLKPGDFLIVHQSGTLIRMFADGNIAISAGGSPPTAPTGSNSINLTSTNAANINADGLIAFQSLIKSSLLAPDVVLGDASNLANILPLATSAVVTWIVSVLVPYLNAHTHDGVTTGVGISGIPTVPVVGITTSAPYQTVATEAN